MEIISAKNLSFSYPNTDEYALNNINFSVNKGEKILVCGESGCGKSTLLKLLKKEIAPFGKKEGTILIDDNIKTIGYVMQNPDNQFVTETVISEMAFGPENLGLSPEIIKRRIGETANYLGLQNIMHKNVNELSGGQKQLVNLASILTIQPDILLLDEPTSQLDPIAAADFLNTIHSLNRDFGMTVIIAEQRFENLFFDVDRVMILQKGDMICFDRPNAVGNYLKENYTPVSDGLPSFIRIFNSLNLNINEDICNVNSAKLFLQKTYNKYENQLISDNSSEKADVEIKNISFRYSKDGIDIINSLSVSFKSGKISCVLGGNASGKTTLLKLIAGILKPYKGKIEIMGKPIEKYKGNSLYSNCVAYMPQNPISLFLKDTVIEDLKIIDKENSLDGIIKLLGINDLLYKNPLDLSGGELQKCALAKILLSNPKIILLDEPTKGIDPQYKKQLGEILQTLKKSGITLIIVTHDVEFAAQNADLCYMLFDGEISAENDTQSFFSENNYYTTCASIVSRDVFKNAVTCEQVIECCKKAGMKK